MSARKYLRPEKAETPSFCGRIHALSLQLVRARSSLYSGAFARDEVSLVFRSRFGSLARPLIERREYVSPSVLQNLVGKRRRSLCDRP
jgi:hypothetical protein